jgi:hypothetical protein
MRDNAIAQSPQRNGVLTLHYGYNEGAVLQAMATCQLLQSLDLTESSEVVDHRYPAKQRVYGPAETPREQAILDSINRWLPLSSERFESEDRRTTLDYCSARYRSLVVGSDVVWALRYVGKLRRFFPGGVLPRQSDPFFPAFPNVYWPDDSVRCEKVAYAASCGNLDPREIPAKDRMKMAKILDGFAGISVRDEKTLRLVETCSELLAGQTAVVPDPTVAFNLLEIFDGSSSLEKLRLHGFTDGEKWALLVMKEGRASRLALHALKEKGFRVAATGGYDGNADLDLVACGLSPIEWGWMPRYFDLNVTERMHSSIFTVLNQTPLVALDMNRQIEGTKTKLEERMENFGLGEYYAHQDQLSGDQLRDLVDAALADSVDWEAVSGQIDIERRTASNFLRNTIRR